MKGFIVFVVDRNGHERRLAPSKDVAHGQGKQERKDE